MSTRNAGAVRRLRVVDAPNPEKTISFAALESTSTDVNNPHTSFNARLYWRIILLKAFLDSSQRQMSEEEVEELLAFFSRLGEEAANQRQEPPRKRRAA
ncbi:MAG TPA: hypothetical protein VF707_08140 [Ardenticatenaceae bacterium]|jgi:hypothetical protein